ncbi:hypothetical protein [Streptomyces niveiscabiei]|uniref:Uncharacterized protein n=1 Tax=Streptomyces niveiscabiei TaxID=164115 RepID=A0ABW9HL26_9ACTN
MDAPILFANSIGGYVPSPVADATGTNATGGAQLLALAPGFVIMEPGARGRTRRVRAARRGSSPVIPV